MSQFDFYMNLTDREVTPTNIFINQSGRITQNINDSYNRERLRVIFIHISYRLSHISKLVMYISAGKLQEFLDFLINNIQKVILKINCLNLY